MWASAVNTITELKAIAPSYRGDKGYPVPVISSPFGAIWYFWVPDSAIAPDDLDVVIPDDLTSANPGRWLRLGSELLARTDAPQAYNKAQSSAVVSLPENQSAIDLNAKDSNRYVLVLSTNATITIINSGAGDSFGLCVKQGAIGGRTLQFANAITPQGGIAIASAPGARTEIGCRCYENGVWLCSVAGVFA